MHHVILSNLGLTNPLTFLMQAGRQRERERQHLVTGEGLCCKGVDSLWMVHVNPAVSLAAGCWALGTMCTTIMFLSTLALVLRQHFIGRAKT